MASVAEWAYVAGLLEGEGSFLVGRKPRIQINMTDVEPLMRVQSTAGGRVLGPYAPVPPGRKQFWRWYLCTWGKIEFFCEKIRPWMSPRRTAKMDEMLALAPPMDERGSGWVNRKKTHCPHGHPYSFENTYVFDGHRQCRTCRTEHVVQSRARRPEDKE